MRERGGEREREGGREREREGERERERGGEKKESASFVCEVCLREGKRSHS
jgi:hypothetical protein